jgi:hypothetical protein
MQNSCADLKMVPRCYLLLGVNGQQCSQILSKSSEKNIIGKHFRSALQGCSLWFRCMRFYYDS